jgi:hypothetical protein
MRGAECLYSVIMYTHPLSSTLQPNYLSHVQPTKMTTISSTIKSTNPSSKMPTPTSISQLLDTITSILHFLLHHPIIRNILQFEPEFFPALAIALLLTATMLPLIIYSCVNPDKLSSLKNKTYSTKPTDSRHEICISTGHRDRHGVAELGE